MVTPTLTRSLLKVSVSWNTMVIKPRLAYDRVLWANNVFVMIRDDFCQLYHQAVEHESPAPPYSLETNQSGSLLKIPVENATLSKAVEHGEIDVQDEYACQYSPREEEKKELRTFHRNPPHRPFDTAD